MLRLLLCFLYAIGLLTKGLGFFLVLFLNDEHYEVSDSSFHRLCSAERTFATEETSGARSDPLGTADALLTAANMIWAWLRDN